MKKIVTLLTLFFMCLIMKAQTIAIFDFDAGNGVPQEFADSVTSVFKTSFQIQDFVILDSAEIYQAVENLGYSRGGMKKPQRIEVGKAINADRVVYGNINLVEDKFVVIAGSVKVETAETETMFKANITEITGSEKIIAELAQRISAKIEVIAAEEKKQKEQKEEEAKEKQMPPKSFTVNDVTFEMIYVEGGTFQMGATEEQGKDVYDAEKPVHKVVVDDFYIGKFEVTQGLWKAVMGSEITDSGGWRGYGYGDNFPAYRVSWKDCQAFVKKLNELTGENFRLPYEAEWEYAARGGNKSEGHKYSGSDVVNDVAWYTSNTYDSGTQPVGTKTPNELGIYDMSGNVWEWCMDWYGDYEDKAIKNPKGKASGNNKVLRGGSWSRGSKLCRIASRGYNLPDARFSYNGFRLVLVVEQPVDEKAE